MASVTWKGEPAGPDDEGPKSITGGGMTFKRGEAVEVKDPALIATLKGNPFFEVTGADVDPDAPSATIPPPSQQSAQYPVPKGGEPVTIPPPILAPKVPRV
jgi:hypothetical protein